MYFAILPYCMVESEEPPKTTTIHLQCFVEISAFVVMMWRLECYIAASSCFLITSFMMLYLFSLFSFWLLVERCVCIDTVIYGRIHKHAHKLNNTYRDTIFTIFVGYFTRFSFISFGIALRNFLIWITINLRIVTD